MTTLKLSRDTAFYFTGTEYQLLLRCSITAPVHSPHMVGKAEGDVPLGLNRDSGE